jgi:hypothetical protein
VEPILQSVLWYAPASCLAHDSYDRGQPRHLVPKGSVSGQITCPAGNRRWVSLGCHPGLTPAFAVSTEQSEKHPQATIIKLDSRLFWIQPIPVHAT